MTSTTTRPNLAGSPQFRLPNDTFCRSAVNAERTRDRTTAARSRGRQPAASRHDPHSSETRRRSSAATACWAVPSVSDSVRSGQRRSRRPRSRSTHRSVPATPQPRRDLLGLERSISRSLRVSADTPIVRPSPTRGQRVPSGVRPTAGRPASHFRAAPPSRLAFDCDRPHSCQSAQRYWRSAADARGSEATDASVRLQRRVSQRPTNFRLPPCDGAPTPLRLGSALPRRT